jgi:hypothetical protein
MKNDYEIDFIKEIEGKKFYGGISAKYSFE